MSKAEKQVHPFEPIYDSNSRILVLGTMPSVASRQNRFYYAHPQNRFWKVLSLVLDTPLPLNIREKREMLLRHGIALWDVLKSCRIYKSQDSSIKDPVVNDFEPVLRNSQICAVFANGSKAGSLYRKLAYPQTGIPCTVLPSTSPANAQYSLEKLVQEWMVIREYLAPQPDDT